MAIPRSGFVLGWDRDTWILLCCTTNFPSQDSPDFFDPSVCIDCNLVSSRAVRQCLCLSVIEHVRLQHAGHGVFRKLHILRWICSQNTATAKQHLGGIWHFPGIAMKSQPLPVFSNERMVGQWASATEPSTELQERVPVGASSHTRSVRSVPPMARGKTCSLPEGLSFRQKIHRIGVPNGYGRDQISMRSRLAGFISHRRSYGRPPDRRIQTLPAHSYRYSLHCLSDPPWATADDEPNVPVAADRSQAADWQKTTRVSPQAPTWERSLLVGSYDTSTAALGAAARVPTRRFAVST